MSTASLIREMSVKSFFVFDSTCYINKGTLSPRSYNVHHNDEEVRNSLHGQVKTNFKYAFYTLRSWRMTFRAAIWVISKLYIPVHVLVPLNWLMTMHARPNYLAIDCIIFMLSKFVISMKNITHQRFMHTAQGQTHRNVCGWAKESAKSTTVCLI
jgi:hypothetical protein